MQCGSMLFKWTLVKMRKMAPFETGPFRAETHTDLAFEHMSPRQTLTPPACCQEGGGAKKLDFGLCLAFAAA